ncbi:MAG TPA: hypothetical protein VFH13_07030, partial [Gemmatimonadaceae bacterium]|nr:hypothetical protein [Gemmatimonadaceae bacterium]
MIPVQLLLIAAAAAGTHPVTTTIKSDPRITYTVTINPADLSGIDVAMKIEGAPPTIRLAMAVHPEYNDRFWRYVSDLRADDGGKPLTIGVEKENAWRIQTPGGAAIVRYRIQLPQENPTNRAVWHTALRADGASINSTDTFIYLPDFPRSAVEVAFNIPESWQIRTALPGGTTPVLDARYTVSADATTLLDSPILLGALRTWNFAVQGVPHRVVYWPLPNATPFDTTEFVSAIERLAQQAFALFGKAPYDSYTFLFEDGAWGGLEHVRSVRIGAQSSELAKDPRHYMGEIAHEF